MPQIAAWSSLRFVRYGLSATWDVLPSKDERVRLELLLNSVEQSFSFLLCSELACQGRHRPKLNL